MVMPAICLHPARSRFAVSTSPATTVRPSVRPRQKVVKWNIPLNTPDNAFKLFTGTVFGASVYRAVIDYRLTEIQAAWLKFLRACRLEYGHSGCSH
ncbi:hypothetical protein EMIT0P4_230036 [Pseudomonas sp. IT-P4]